MVVRTEGDKADLSHLALSVYPVMVSPAPILAPTVILYPGLLLFIVTVK